MATISDTALSVPFQQLVFLKKTCNKLFLLTCGLTCGGGLARSAGSLIDSSVAPMAMR